MVEPEKLNECCRKAIAGLLLQVAESMRKQASEKQAMFARVGLDGYGQVQVLLEVADSLERAAQAGEGATIPVPDGWNASMTESQFIALYGRVVEKAKELLSEANRRREDGNDWPAGQRWESLTSSSRGFFLHRARASMDIDHNQFLETLRNWPYSDAGWERIEELFGRL